MFIYLLLIQIGYQAEGGQGGHHGAKQSLKFLGIHISLNSD